MTAATDPFMVSEVRFRPAGGAFRGRKPVLIFVDARAVQRRLDAVDANWASEHDAPVVLDVGTKSKKNYQGVFVPLQKVAVACRLTVNGVSRTDIGESVGEAADEKAFKTAFSDSLKRAAVQFGVGAYLYDLPPFSVAEAEVDYGRISARGLQQLASDYTKILNGEAPEAAAQGESSAQPVSADGVPIARSLGGSGVMQAGGDLFPHGWPFGKEKGKPLSEVSDNAVEWFVSKYETRDTRFVDQDEKRKAACRVELERRVRGESDIPPDESGIANLQETFSATAQDDQIPF